MFISIHRPFTSWHLIKCYTKLQFTCIIVCEMCNLRENMRRLENRDSRRVRSEGWTTYCLSFNLSIIRSSLRHIASGKLSSHRIPRLITDDDDLRGLAHAGASRVGRNFATGSRIHLRRCNDFVRVQRYRIKRDPARPLIDSQ